jgi:hypothetical protein
MCISTDYIEFFRLAWTHTMHSTGDELNLTVPFDFRYDIYGADLSTVAATTIVTYNDAAATPVESSRDVTTVTTTFARPLDLRVATGASVKKTFHPTDNTRLHLGGGLDFEFIGENTTWTRQSVRNYQVDNNSDGAYTTAGTDVSTVYTQSGYEAIGRTYEYNFDLTGAVAVSYNPIGILTFHAGASTVASVDLESVSTLRTGDSGYLYEAYTDNLDAANTYARRQKDGSNNLSIPSSEFYSDFSFSTVGFFGFTLDFSESFRIDARSTIGTVGFSSFSVIGVFSPEGRTP